MGKGEKATESKRDVCLCVKPLVESSSMFLSQEEIVSFYRAIIKFTDVQKSVRRLPGCFYDPI